MLSRTAAAVLCALLPTACTIVVQAPPDDEDASTGSPGPVSFGSESVGEEPAADDDDSTSTGEIVDGTTGGIDETSTGEVIDKTTGDDTTSSSSTGDDSTTSEDTTSTTTGDGSKGLGEPCLADADCESAACISYPLDDDVPVPRCSTPCSIETADDCTMQGYPNGICLWAGSDSHWCAGSFPTEAGYYMTATPPEPGFEAWSTSALLASPNARHFYLIPTWPTTYHIDLKSLDLGQVALELITSDGSVSKFAADVDHLVVEPQGLNKFRWLVLRPLNEQSHYGLWLTAGE